MFDTEKTQQDAPATPMVRIPDLDVTTDAGRLVRGGVPTVIDGRR